MPLLVLRPELRAEVVYLSHAVGSRPPNAADRSSPLVVGCIGYVVPARLQNSTETEWLEGAKSENPVDPLGR